MQTETSPQGILENGNAKAPERFIRKGSFDDVLAVVEGAFDTNASNIFVRYGGHLPFLDLAYASLREHDEAIHVLFPTKAVDRGGTCLLETWMQTYTYTRSWVRSHARVVARIDEPKSVPSVFFVLG